MSALFSVFVAVILMNSSFQQKISPETNDDDLIEEFRSLFAEFLGDPQRYHPSKRVRDTSGSDKKEPHHNSGQTKRGETDEEPTGDRPDLLPLYPCNYFDASARSCVNVRQLGTTLTIGVKTKERNKFPIHWYRFFKVRGEDEGKSLKFVKLARGNMPWNINIGGENNELRISPITEIDFSYNFFLATLDEGSPEDVQKKAKKRLRLLKFSIEPISIDMGTLYHGEEIALNVRSFMELPRRSVRYEWATVGKDYGVRHNLPSNMKLSLDGSTIIIKEHRSHGDMVLTCAVFSNKDFHLGRRNFFLRKIVLTKNPNVKIESGPEFSRKRRYLDDFYVQPNWDTGRLSKLKRNSEENPKIVIEAQGVTYVTPQPDQSAPPKDFSEISNPPPSNSPFDLVDKPQETVLNFYGDPPTPENIESETEVLQLSGGKQSPKSQSFDGLFGEANQAEQRPQVDKSGEEYPESKIIVEKRLTAEDKESLLISGCKDDADCGINAVCFSIERNRKFCKCKPHYRGNGMFCWSF